MKKSSAGVYSFFHTAESVSNPEKYNSASKRSWLGRYAWLAIATMAIVFGGFQVKSEAAQVLVDFTFGTVGIVKTDLSTLRDGVRDVVLQSDGKIVAVGHANRGSAFGIARYNSNGSLDSTFGNGGKVVTVFVAQDVASAEAVALQSDGKIIAAGYSRTSPSSLGFDFALVRYNANGSLDTGFGTGGKRILDFGVNNMDLAEDVVIQPDGKVIAVGRSYGINAEPYWDFSLARFNSDGTLDTSFGVGGKVNTNFGYEDTAQSVFLTSDGKIVVGGDTKNVGTLFDFTVVRYNNDGSLDTTFGTGGRSHADLGQSESMVAMTQQVNGKIVCVGDTGNPLYDIAIIRFNADGSLDSSFGDGGKRTIGFATDSSEAAKDVTVQPDGKIVVAGAVSIPGAPPPRGDFAVVRLNSDGSLDTSFDSDGMFSTNLSSYDSSDIAYAIVIQPDGKIVLGGDSNGSGAAYEEEDFALVRLQTTARSRAKPYDFDGDGIADLAVFRPSNGTWYIRTSSNNGLYAQFWGTNDDIPEPGDFDGDSRDDLVIFRNGTWYVNTSYTLSVFAMQFGTMGDIPVTADYDGDGRADFAVFRPSNGTWYIFRSSDSVLLAVSLGANGDKPVAGDYNGDGRADVAVWRPSNGTWYTSTNPGTNYDAFAWGQNGDVAVPGDYDGDGKSDRAVFRPSTATWWILNSSNGSYVEQQFGVGSDKPVPADYDGDGRTNIAVYRPSTSRWYTSLSPATNYGEQLWGLVGDIPVETSNVP